MKIRDKRLLSPPIARAAYSDRTAWLLAEMSQLAYEKFEGRLELVEVISRELAPLNDPGAIKKKLEAFLQEYPRPDEEALANLSQGLSEADFTLVETFNNQGTQAFLAKRDSDRLAVLAFRGTEKDHRDILTDLKARFFATAQGRVHRGFWSAFETVAPEVKPAIARLKDYKLYITGHSLGGALALVAARELSADHVAACYTYGSPKVGTSDFGDPIKVPIYRVVNAADAVPRVPPTWIIEVVILLARLLPVPFLRGAIIRVLQAFRGYRHHGDMRYLSASEAGDSSLRLIANPNIIDRARWVIARLLTTPKAGFSDHRIALYCDKLQRVALRRLGEEPAGAQETQPSPPPPAARSRGL